MDSSYRYWLVVHPDIQRPIGGIKQIHRLAEAISSLSRSATLIQDTTTFHPGWFKSNVDTISAKEWFIRRNNGEFSRNRDILIFPETCLGQAAEYANGLPIVIFNQNVSYSFGVKGSSVVHRPSSHLKLYRSSLVKHVLCVSQYDYNTLNYAFGIPDRKISLVINGIEPDAAPAKIKKKIIAYMNRKNSFDSLVVVSLLQELSSLKGWHFKCIQNQPHAEVLDVLSESLIFLSFGYPEGFGLPVAEALACGCCVVGYSGLGGRELFALASNHSVATEVPVGDWSAFLDSVNLFAQTFNTSPSSILRALQHCSEEISQSYSLESLRNSVCHALAAIENGLS